MKKSYFLADFSAPIEKSYFISSQTNGNLLDFGVKEESKKSDSTVSLTNKKKVFAPKIIENPTQVNLYRSAKV